MSDTEAPTITSSVARQFMAIRQTGAYSMMDSECVKEAARKVGHTDLAERIEEDKSILGPIVFGQALVEHNDDVLTMDEWTDLHDF